MSAKVVLYCDRCGAETKWDTLPLRIDAGVLPAAAKEEGIDLCESCCRMTLMNLVAKMTPAEAAEWLVESRKPWPTVRA